jgi:hypothetical protein
MRTVTVRATNLFQRKARQRGGCRHLRLKPVRDPQGAIAATARIVRFYEGRARGSGFRD